MAVTSSEAFFQVLKKSELLSEEELDEIRQKYGGEDDPKGIARILIKVGKINKWQALQLLGGRHALTLGKYKLLNQIGSDQKSRVFLAEHTQMGRRVAINALSRQHATENPKSVKRFVDQASKLAALDHRNIVHVYDVDDTDDRCYVVLEYVEGRSLKQMLDERGAMPAAQVAQLIGQAAAGLAYAHKENHIHGDLRPANLLVDGQGTVKIANLGLKGLTTSEDDEGATASAAYVAPETTAGEPSGDPRSDIYSLGCVMYALLAGHPPAAKDGAGQEEVEAPSVLDDRPDAPEPLVTLCGRMMANDPAERLQSAGEVELRLVEWLKSARAAKPAPSRSKAPGESTNVGGAQTAKAATPTPRKGAQSKKSPDQQKPSVGAAKPDAGKLADAAAGGMGEFAINTKRRRRPKKSKAAAGDGDAVAVADGAEAKSIPKAAYIIGGAAAGGLVLVGGVVLLLVFLFSNGDGDDVEVAEAGNGEASAEGAADTTGTESGGDSDPEADPEMDPELDPVMEVDPAPAPATDDDTATGATNGKTDSDGSETTTSKPADEPSSDDTAAKATNSKDSPGTKASEDSTAKASDTTPQKPAGKKPTEKPVEKPVAKKPAAKKQPAKPTKKPFVELPTLVSLPDLDSADAMKPNRLGSIYTGTEELCFIKLRGGKDAAKGSQLFVMRNADSGLADRDWEISSREGESGPETKIAHLSLGDNSQLSFRWLPEAKTQSLSAHLSNCALSFNCRGESQIALLRQPTRVEGLAVDLKKAALKENWDIDLPPDPSAIRVEIMGVQDGKCTIEPAPTFDAEKGEAWVRLDDGGGMLSLQVETSLKRSFQVSLAPYMKLSPDVKPEKLSTRNLQRYKTVVQSEMQQLQFNIQQGQTMLNARKRGKADRQAKDLEQRLNQGKFRLKELETALASIDELEKTVERLSGKLRLNFRVFFNADSTEVDLLRIGG